MTDPFATARVGGYDTSGNASSVAVSGQFAYLTEEFVGLQVLVIDISNPSSPQRVGSLSTSGGAYDLTVAGSFAYMADGAGIKVINISNPANPSFVGRYDTSQGAFDVAAYGQFAYAGGDIIDISNPLALGRAGDFRKGAVSALTRDFAFAAGGRSGLQVFDMSVQSTPNRVGSNQVLDALGIAVAGDKIFVATAENGLAILEMPLAFADPGTLNPDNSFQLRWFGGSGIITLETSTDLLRWDPVTSEPASVEIISAYTNPPSEFSPTGRYFRLIAR